MSDGALSVAEYKRAAELLMAAAHPTRLRIISELSSARIALSPTMLTARLSCGATLGDVAYHVRQLHAAGVIDEVDRKRRRGAWEHFYRLTDDGRTIARPARSLLNTTGRIRVYT